MAPKSANPKDLFVGGVLGCIEAATLGMPFEVWKTHMGTYRSETTMQAFWNIYNKNGVAGFWKGLSPKMIEAFVKGGMLLFAKEAIIKVCTNVGIGEATAGLLGGAGGGFAQVTILGPCTFLVTAAVTGDKSISMMSRIKSTYSNHGIAGFYRGGTALALRQGSNWASRQGFTDGVRVLLKQYLHGDKKAKLSTGEEALAGIIGGTLSVWNQPFEVMRIEAQAAATRGLKARGFVATFQDIVKQDGLKGLFKGVVPRVGICIWQTLFMVTAPKLMQRYGF